MKHLVKIKYLLLVVVFPCFSADRRPLDSLDSALTNLSAWPKIGDFPNKVEFMRAVEERLRATRQLIAATKETVAALRAIGQGDDSRG